jgi:rhodanese-related sulfurtransferase
LLAVALVIGAVGPANAQVVDGHQAPSALLATGLATGASATMASALVSPAVALAEAEQAMRNVPRITVDELKALMDQKAVVIIDVRGPDQFKEGRIPGAINVDYTEMPGRAKQFKGETKTIVAYCACVSDTTAARAALDLAAAGVPGAKALAGGWNEWVKKGMAIEK